MTTSPEHDRRDRPNAGPGDAPRARVRPLPLQPRLWRLLLVCVTVELALVAADYWINYRELADSAGLRHLFNITREDGLASLFAVLQTAAVAAVAWGIRAVQRADVSPSTPPERLHYLAWTAVALFFSYLTIDDGAALHERISTAIEEGSDGALPGSYPSFAWQLLVLPILAIAGAVTIIFLWRILRTRHQRSALVAVVGCMAAAVGLDFLEGLDADRTWNPYPMLVRRFNLDAYAERLFFTDGLDAMRHFSRSLEETLEMFAMSLLLVLLLGHLAVRVRGVVLSDVRN